MRTGIFLSCHIFLSGVSFKHTPRRFGHTTSASGAITIHAKKISGFDMILERASSTVAKNFIVSTFVSMVIGVIFPCFYVYVCFVERDVICGRAVRSASGWQADLESGITLNIILILVYYLRIVAARAWRNPVYLSSRSSGLLWEKTIAIEHDLCSSQSFGKQPRFRSSARTHFCCH